MGIIYYDLEVKPTNEHPAFTLDETHPCYRMVRSKEGDKVFFQWNEEEALQMYKYYNMDFNLLDIFDELGRAIPSYEWKDYIEEAYYLTPYGNVSNETIHELWKRKKSEDKERAAKEEADRQIIEEESK